VGRRTEPVRGRDVADDNKSAYARLSPDLVRYAAFLVGPADAPEVVLDVAVRCLFAKNWPSVKDQDAYLHRIVLREAYRRTNPSRLAWRRLRPEPHGDLGPLTTLTVEQRALLYLTYVQTLDVLAASHMTGLRRRIVRARLVEARDALGVDDPESIRSLIDATVVALPPLPLPDGAVVPRLPYRHRNVALSAAAIALGVGFCTTFVVVPFERSLTSLGHEERGRQLIIAERPPVDQELAVDLSTERTSPFYAPGSEGADTILDAVGDRILIWNDSAVASYSPTSGTATPLGSADYAIPTNDGRAVWLVNDPSHRNIDPMPGPVTLTAELVSLKGKQLIARHTLPRFSFPVATLRREVILSVGDSQDLWNVVTGRSDHRFGTMSGFVTANATTLVTATGCTIHSFAGHSYTADRPCRRLRVVAIRSKRVRVYPPPRARNTTSWIGAGSLSPDGRYLATFVGRDHATDLHHNGTISIDDASRLARLVVVDLRRRTVSAVPDSEVSEGEELVAWSPDSRWLFYPNRDGYLGAYRRGSRQAHATVVPCCTEAARIFVTSIPRSPLDQSGPMPTLPVPTVTAVPTPTASASAEPACSPSQLGLAYHGGGLGTGNDFGGIVVRNISPFPCVLTGTVGVQALTAPSDPPITLFGGGTDLPGPSEIPMGFVLTPRAPASTGPSPLPADVKEAFIALVGGERDDPKTGMDCRPSDEVTPAYWRVRIVGGSFIVRNHDGGDVPALFACRAGFGIDGVIPA